MASLGAEVKAGTGRCQGQRHSQSQKYAGNQAPNSPRSQKGLEGQSQEIGSRKLRSGEGGCGGGGLFQALPKHLVCLSSH